jgi:hypothetical protein
MNVAATHSCEILVRLRHLASSFGSTIIKDLAGMPLRLEGGGA